MRKSFGRGSKRRSQAGMALLSIAELTPEPLMRTVGNIMSPPKKGK